jgi:GNAT superfamily N-acetyltransferase
VANEPILSEFLHFERLSGNHSNILTTFRNQESELIEFLKHDALENQTIHVSTTFLVFSKESENIMVGYITLLADSIRIRERKDLEKRFKKKNVFYSYLPAIKIGRAAVDENWQRKGIGKSMIKFATEMADKINEYAGCRFLTVESKAGARSFYEKLGFKVLIEKEGRPISMYLDLLELK